MAGNYHTAKTLEKGTSEFGMTFSATKYSFKYDDTQTDPNTGQTTTTQKSVDFAIPNLLPELTYHIGVSDNAEAGGRISLGSLGGEFDIKYRLIHDGKLHVAVAPAIGYQAAFLIQGGGLRLPGILTYELTDNLDFNAAAFVSETHWKPVSDSEDFQSWSGNLTQTGVALGFDLHGETMSIRPAFEWSRVVYSANGRSDFEPFNTFNVLVHIAFIGGREKKQLDRIEHKLDNMQQGYPPQQYPPPQYPPPQYPPPQYPPGQYPPPQQPQPAPPAAPPPA
jgi:hypothetical protein